MKSAHALSTKEEPKMAKGRTHTEQWEKLAVAEDYLTEYKRMATLDRVSILCKKRRTHIKEYSGEK